MWLSKKYILVILFFSFFTPANAYLDPGTGGSLVQIIIATLAAIGASISLYWQRFKSFIKKLFAKEKKEKE